MIFGLLIKYYKTYKGWHYIPLSNGKNFSALLGENGVGKSSVLEALDVFFNKPHSEWNYNHSVNKSGINTSKPSICPIFIIKKEKINKARHLYKHLETISDITWQIETENFNPSLHHIATPIIEHMEKIKKTNKQIDNEYFLIPCGLTKKDNNSQLSMGPFDSVREYNDDLKILHSIEIKHVLNELLEYIKNEMEYIYIPSEIDYEHYTKIEGKTIQSLMGTSVDEIIKGCINESAIKDINNGLDKYLEEIGVNLKKYIYKKPTKRQKLFNLSHLTAKIIETYFDSKVLNLVEGGKETPIYNLSSGEKRKAVIDLTQAFILNSNRDLKSKTVILAMDEPEVSLHTSSCFEQFNKLENISKNHVQTIISTHWYGFFPAVSSGSATYISNDEDAKVSHIIELSRFREDIKDIRKKTSGNSPKNIELKSINDLVQSIVASITYSKRKWVICEGYSDKIYLEHFLSDYKELTVLSMGGCPYVKKLYEYLLLALDEIKGDIQGKVFLMVDTDIENSSFSIKEPIKKILFRRIINKENKTILIKPSDSLVNPPTEIEDVLNASVFESTLMHFSMNEDIDYKFTYDGTINYDFPSGTAFDFRQSEKEELKAFFNQEGIKVMFAEKYCELDKNKRKPDFIINIELFLNN